MSRLPSLLILIALFVVGLTGFWIFLFTNVDWKTGKLKDPWP